MSLGEQLVKLREAKGLSLEELADETHIGPHVLKELEADDFSRLSAAIYGSGFVKILAKYYGIDAAPLRETFEREYREWAAGRDALPRPKAPPLKFGAGRHIHPPTQLLRRPRPPGFHSPRPPSARITSAPDWGSHVAHRTCQLVAELDYSGETPRVSYLAGFPTPNRLCDSNGQAWFDAPGEANAPDGDVSVGGATSVAALCGQMAYRPEDKTCTIFFVR